MLYGVKGGTKGPIVVAQTRNDQTTSEKVLDYSQVFWPGDTDMVLHLMTDSEEEAIVAAVHKLKAGLPKLGIGVSTGRVVDFRARALLRQEAVAGTVPLIFPVHFRHGLIRWPDKSGKKSNAILESDATKSLLVPSGFYVLVKRFSAKEERRRIVAALLDPHEVKAERLAFDNKTNFFHVAGRGLPEGLARGLAVYLNSTIVDRYFRLFSGHTQVNADDLRRLPYPSSEQLLALAASCHDLSDQAQIDRAVEALTS